MTCSVAECDRTAIARGWCRRHYGRWLERGTTDLAFDQSPGGVCTCRTPDPDHLADCRTCRRLVPSACGCAACYSAIATPTSSPLIPRSGAGVGVGTAGPPGVRSQVSAVPTT